MRNSENARRDSVGLSRSTMAAVARRHPFGQVRHQLLNQAAYTEETTLAKVPMVSKSSLSSFQR